MNSARCLAWCHDYGGSDMDRRTALHVVEWLADSAARVASSAEDRRAVDAARENARSLTVDRRCQRMIAKH